MTPGNTFDFFDPTKDTYQTGDLSWLYGDGSTFARYEQRRMRAYHGAKRLLQEQRSLQQYEILQRTYEFPFAEIGSNVAFTRTNITAEAQYRALYTANQMRAESPVPTYIYVIGLGNAYLQRLLHRGFSRYDGQRPKCVELQLSFESGSRQS